MEKLKLKENRINIENVMYILFSVCVIVGIVGCFYFAGFLTTGFVQFIIGCCFSGLFLVAFLLLLTFISDTLIFKDEYYILERNDCGSLSYKPVHQLVLGIFILQTRCLLENYVSDKKDAENSIEAKKVELEKERCKVEYRKIEL